MFRSRRIALRSLSCHFAREVSAIPGLGLGWAILKKQKKEKGRAGRRRLAFFNFTA
jgi:hypothetical protein